MGEEEHRDESEGKEDVIAGDAATRALEDARKKNEEYLEMLQRLQADFENYKKRVAREGEEVRNMAEADIMTELLPLLDDVERALSHEKNEVLAIIHAQMKRTFEKRGLEEVENAAFDPYYHEVVAVVTRAELPEDAIVEVLKKGYKMRGRVIRHSQVVVNKK